VRSGTRDGTPRIQQAKDKDRDSREQPYADKYFTPQSFFWNKIQSRADP
jgi:hypothetical protein